MTKHVRADAADRLPAQRLARDGDRRCGLRVGRFGRPGSGSQLRGPCGARGGRADGVDDRRAGRRGRGDGGALDDGVFDARAGRVAHQHVGVHAADARPAQARAFGSQHGGDSADGARVTAVLARRAPARTTRARCCRAAARLAPARCRLRTRRGAGGGARRVCPHAAVQGPGGDDEVAVGGYGGGPAARREAGRVAEAAATGRECRLCGGCRAGGGDGGEGQQRDERHQQRGVLASDLCPDIGEAGGVMLLVHLLRRLGGLLWEIPGSACPSRGGVAFIGEWGASAGRGAPPSARLRSARDLSEVCPRPMSGALWLGHMSAPGRAPCVQVRREIWR